MNQKMFISLAAVYFLLLITAMPSRAAEAKQSKTGSVEGIVVQSHFSIPGQKLTLESKEFIPKTSTPLRYVFTIHAPGSKTTSLGQDIEKPGNRLKVEYQNLRLSEMDYFYEGNATRVVKILDASVASDPLLGRMKSAADQEATKLGYNTRKMAVDVDADNSKWKKYRDTQGLPQNVSKIEGKDYIAVSYYPIPPPGHATMGGDLWVFVDRRTAEVITVLRGQ